MKSYAVIDQLEWKYAICEVELIETENSNSDDYFAHETSWMEVPIFMIVGAIGTVEENDVLVVEHDGENVSVIYCKSEEEMKRRNAVFDRIMGN